VLFDDLRLQLPLFWADRASALEQGCSLRETKILYYERLRSDKCAKISPLSIKVEWNWTSEETLEYHPSKTAEGNEEAGKAAGKGRTAGAEKTR